MAGKGRQYFSTILLLLSVGCDGVIGSDRRLDSCGICGGNNSTCRVVSGLFTRPQLPLGYNLITQIPRAACNISIAHLKPTRNYLALRRVNGTYVLNGNWAINWSGDYEAVGTTFNYRRDSGESIAASGPLDEPIDLMLIYQEPNSGIKYQYQLPMAHTDSMIFTPQETPIAPPLISHPTDSSNLPSDGASPRKSADSYRHKKVHSHNNYGLSETDSVGLADEAQTAKPRCAGWKRNCYSWRVTAYSPCSRTCGGGIKKPKYECINEYYDEVVSNRRCRNEPEPSPVKCNENSCGAEWVEGKWGVCSVTCGDGVQTREVSCSAGEATAGAIKMTSLANDDVMCLKPAPPTTRVCSMGPCPATPAWWVEGKWSGCSVTCGEGVQTRELSCRQEVHAGIIKTIDEAFCLKPAPQRTRACSMTPCSPPAWFYTDWSQQCSESCGTGVQTRRVHCSGSQCDISLRPEDSRACSSYKQCRPTWFSGSWSQCSVTCGLGRQTRTVICVETMGGKKQILPEESCTDSERPTSEQQCQLQPCGSQWLTGEWGTCSESCGLGVQKRELRCLDENELVSATCSEQTKPAARRSCNAHPCKDENPEASPVNDSNSLVEQTPVDNSDKQCNSPHCNSHCTDKFPNCHLVVQARLCKYKYYRNSCCRSCKNKA